MQRRALVVGVSQYSKVSLGNFVSFANNANAIADILEPTFKVKRFPESVDGDLVRVGKSAVTCDRLQNELKELFTATDLDVVLFYFSGHGLKGKQLFPRTYLAASDSEWLDDGYRRAFEIEDLKSLLKNCPAKEQIVWLDCCYGGDLANFAEMCDRNDGKTRFIITASRSQDPAYQEIAGQMGVFTRVLVEALARTGTAERRITCAAIEDAVREKLQSLQYPQMPQFYRTPNRTIQFWDRQSTPMDRELTIKQKINALETEIDSLRNMCLRADDIRKRYQLNMEIDRKSSSIKTLEQFLENQNQNAQKISIRKIDLAQINFKTARSQIEEHYKILESQGGFLSLIVDHYHNYKGDLLIDEIRDRFKNGKPKFKSIIIDPKSRMWSDIQGLLLNIANELHPNMTVETTELTPEYLIEKLIQQCYPGRIFFFELLNWGELKEHQSDLLIWFYDSFWNSLIARKRQIDNQAKKVRFISVVSSKGKLKEECFNWNYVEVLKVEPSKWSEKEIDEWLAEYGEFTSNNETSEMAKSIIDVSDGLPLAVCAELQQHFCFI